MIIDEVEWFPRPRNFKEAHSMAQDERVANL